MELLRIPIVLVYLVWFRPTTQHCSQYSCGVPLTLPPSLITWRGLQSRLRPISKTRFVRMSQEWASRCPWVYSFIYIYIVCVLNCMGWSYISSVLLFTLLAVNVPCIWDWWGQRFLDRNMVNTLMSREYTMHTFSVATTMRVYMCESMYNYRL